MTCFRGAKVCRKWLQEKVTIKSYSLTTSWNWEQVTSWNWDQDEIGTKKWKIQNTGKSRIGNECVVTKHDADANDNILDCVVLHDADANDNIHDCVALHDANTNDNMTIYTHFHIVWA